MCRSPVCLELIRYWRNLAAHSGGCPQWRQVHLMDLYKIATFVAVKDVIDDGRDFRNRFWGTGLTDALGFEGTNMRVSAYEPAAMRDAVQRRYFRILRTGEPEMVRGHIASMPEHDHLPFELVHLPLRDGGEGVWHIISAYHFGFIWPDDGA
ncbi:MAG: hypothetical protein RIG67_33330 [Rhodospirillales bacterium]